eukprot:SAG31_NODE_1192_length_9459_cov_15.271581_4_plen_332_part_00
MAAAILPKATTPFIFFAMALAMAASASASATLDLRFVSYNVRRFTGPNGTSTVEGIAASLRTLRPPPAFICLNEVDLVKQPGCLDFLATSLGGFTVSFFGHVAGPDGKERYGNALLSRWAPSDVWKIPLAGGTVVESAQGRTHRIHRGLLTAVFEPGLPGSIAAPLMVACTHLDHISESERVVQLDHVVQTLKPQQSRYDDFSTVLLGDLNALTRTDYDDHDWAALEAYNEKAGWNPPQFGCLELLKQAGFVDGFAALGLPIGQRRWTAHVAQPRYRIDYIWSRAPQNYGPSLEPVNAFVLSTAVHSDHFPLVVDYQWPRMTTTPPQHPGL